MPVEVGAGPTANLVIIFFIEWRLCPGNYFLSCY